MVLVVGGPANADVGASVSGEPVLVTSPRRLLLSMKPRPRIALSLAAALLATTASGALSAQQDSVRATGRAQYPHATEPIGTVRQVYDGMLTLQQAVNTFRNIDRLFPSRAVPAASVPMPLPPAAVPLRTVSFSDRGKRYDLEDYLELNRVAGLLVLENGRVALERYQFGNSERTRWMSMSIAKSITSTLIGAAIKQGYVGSLSDPVVKYVPSLVGSAYDGVSLRDVLMMSSGVRWTEAYTDPTSDRRRLLEAQISQVPGSAMAVMRGLPRAAHPGTVNTYSTGETQVAGEVVRRAVGRPLATYLSERIWRRFGMEAGATWWLDSPDGVEIGGSGFSATLRDYGRFGLFLLRGGVAAGEAILPDGWIREATSPKVLRGGTRLAYGYLWWTGETPAAQRDSAYAAIGIYGQWLYVNPAAQVVIVVWAAQRTPTRSAVINDWMFFDAVVDALRRAP
jgi:CubicO group peptidase (beta-lactamase class C family)